MREPEPVPAAPEEGGSLAAVAVGMGAAYLIYRYYMRQKMEDEVKRLGGDLSRKTLLFASATVWHAFVPRWVTLVAPYLVQGYLEGMRNAETGYVPQDVLTKIATDYALALGNHINDVSAEAMISGYQAQVNRKIPPQMAARRVADAYGVTRRGMNTLVNIWTSEDPKQLTDQPLPSSKDERAKAIIEAQQQLRARQIGETESWTARTQAKQIVWMYGMEKGVIPSSARRVWITAADERVCQVCGPMDGVEAKVGDQFSTAEGKLWTPPAHVNCRCDVVLDFNISEDVSEDFKSLLANESVSKARGGDPYDRDSSGRFARQETRRSRIQPQYKQRDADLDVLMAQVNGALNRVHEPTKKPDLSKPKLGLSKPDLSRPNLSPLKLAPLSGSNLKSGLKGGLEKPKLKLNLSGLQRSILDKSPITNKPVSTDAGEWMPLDHPLVLIKTSTDSPASEYGEDVIAFVDQDEAWYELKVDSSMPDKYESSLGKAIGEHWNEFVETEMEDFREQGSEYRAYLNPENGMMYNVDEDAYFQALTHTVENLPSEVAENCILYGFGEFGDEYIKVPANELAEYFNIPEKVSEETPHLIVARHGMPHVTEPMTGTGGELYSNPGKWRVVGEAVHEVGIGSHQDYRVFYVEPEDLFRRE